MHIIVWWNLQPIFVLRHLEHFQDHSGGGSDPFHTLNTIWWHKWHCGGISDLPSCFEHLKHCWYSFTWHYKQSGTSKYTQGHSSGDSNPFHCLKTIWWYKWHCGRVLRFSFSFCPTTRRYVRLPLSFLPHPHIMACVLLWFDLTAMILSYCLMPCTISIWCCDMILSTPMYDTHLRATYMTISSVRGVQIPIYLVSSTTDSLWRSVVVMVTTTVRLT